MAQAVNVNFRLDEDVKKSMEQACADMGLSMSAAFTIFAKKLEEKDAFRLKFRLTHFIQRVIFVTCKRKWKLTELENLNLQNMN